MSINEKLADLMKALEAGSYNAAPGNLNQGAALQKEDLDPVMHNVCFNEQQIKLQKALGIKDAKSTLVQFRRQLDYGIFGGSAQYEGGIGEEDTSNYVNAVVPMAFYSTVKRVSVAANLVASFDGTKADDRIEQDAAMKIAGDVEFDLFGGQDSFTNLGIFDGNPLAIPTMQPGIQGMAVQIRMSDSLSNTQDLMFAEYGSDQTVVISANGTMTQSMIDDMSVKSSMNQGSADKLYLDPISLAAYNKIAHAKERIMLAGSAQEASGANLRTQWTTNGNVSLEPSRFLSGKTSPARARAGSPAAPTCSATNTANAASVLPVGTYYYFATACSMRGESVASTASAATITAGDGGYVTLGAVSGATYYNVYRSAVGAASGVGAKFIGRIAAGSGSVVFRDLGMRSPGSVTGYLVQSNTMGIRQLSPYSKLKAAISDLSLPSFFFRFLCLTMTEPRKNIIAENVSGQV